MDGKRRERRKRHGLGNLDRSHKNFVCLKQSKCVTIELLFDR